MNLYTKKEKRQPSATTIKALAESKAKAAACREILRDYIKANPGETQKGIAWDLNWSLSKVVDYLNQNQRNLKNGYVWLENDSQ